MSKSQNFTKRLAAFIVDKRYGFFLAFIGSAIFCAVASGWVAVNDDLTSYLPADTETRQGVVLMDEEFITLATADVLVDNISYQQALAVQSLLEGIDGVKSVAFDETPEHYRDTEALLQVTFSGEAEDAVSLAAMEQVKEALAGRDVYINSEVGADIAQIIAAEMNIVVVIAIVIILAVLLFTSHTYMEIPVLLLTFGMAAILNMGTNFIFGEISFVSKSIAVVLQLALALDYAIILCHRYTEERALLEPREAVIAALSKALPEISGSSLTTISGLAAMTFMHFRIGYDMGIVLIKAIFFSLLSVFTLMPGLLLLFSKAIDKTHHRSFVPKINLWGKWIIKSRYVVPPVFLVMLLGAFFLSNHCPYVYGYSTLSTVKQNDNQIAAAKIKADFGSTNTIALLVPAGDYKAEERLIASLEDQPAIVSITALANIPALDDYVLTDFLTPRQFSELTELDIEAARLLYSAYAANEDSYGQIVSGIDQFGVPLVDMFMFLYDQKEQGYITLNGELSDELETMHAELVDAKAQLAGANYSRMVLELALPEESAETFAFLDTLHAIAASEYPERVYLVGESTKDRDLSQSFETDNILISILSVVFVIIVLLFTFKSVGLPLLLIVVIQGSIWMNFSFPYLTQSNLFFISYLVVSAIQMGANIDYAIVITNRYTVLKREMPIKEAMTLALNQAFPTIVTSGTMLASAGVLIGQLSSDPTIASIGTCLGRGTVISILLVMGVLPQILLLGDTIIERTYFTLKRPVHAQAYSGNLRINGRVRGYVSGMVDAELHGVLHGTMNAAVETGAIEQLAEEAGQKEAVADEKTEE